MKKYLIGFAAGVALTAAVFFIFGDQIRGGVADSTEQVGEGVQKVGEKIKKTGKKID